MNIIQNSTNLIGGKIKNILIKIGWTAPTSTPEEVESAKLLNDLTIYSTMIFVCLALTFRFFMNLITAILLRSYSLHFRYRLFDIQFSSVDGSKWPFSRILFVFGFSFISLTIVGIILGKIFRKIHNVSWRTRLLLTWSAFLLANSVLAGVISGLLFFNNFGIVVQWMISSMKAMSIVGFGVLLVMILTRPYWVYMFLKSSPSSVFLIDEDIMKVYVQNVFLKAWFWGFLVLLLFNWPILNPFWPIFLLSLGFIAWPLFKMPPRQEEIFIRKSVPTIFKSKNSLYFVAGILIVIRIVGTLFRLNF